VAANNPRRTRSWLWLWVVGAFVLQGAGWTAWFVIASHNKVEAVPLVRVR
jgi:hypothetical protein